MVVWVQVPLAVRYGQTDAYRNCPFFIQKPVGTLGEKQGSLWEIKVLVKV